MELDSVRKLGEHCLAADLEAVVPYSHENLCLERIWKNIRIALHLSQAEARGQGSKRIDQHDDRDDGPWIDTSQGLAVTAWNSPER